MKRILLILLSLLLVLSASLAASANTIPSAETGEKVLFTDDNWAYEKVYVVGMEIDSYIGDDTEISVPYLFGKEAITSIGSDAFLDNKNITAVNTTNQILSIGDYAFNGCTSLSEIYLYDSLTHIGVGCFYGTAALTAINLQDSSVETIPAYCFTDSGITEIAIPSTCTSIGNYSFLNCQSLETVTIPLSVTSIHENAFTGCEKLVIYAPYGSYAIDYAIAHGIDYIYSDLEAYTFKRGDADGDGDITIMDATRVQRVLAKFDDDADGMISLRAAMDDDKVLGIMDATRIQRMLANFDDPYHIGESMTVYLSPDGKVIDAADDSAKSE